MDQQSLQLLQALILILAFLAAVLVLHSMRLKSKSSSHRQPPGPRPWPIVGNLPLLGTLPHQGLARLAKQYGPLMSLRLGSVQTIVVSSPKYAKEFLKTHDLVWSSRPATAAAKILAYQCQDIAAAPYGPRWRYARKVFTLELITVKRLTEFQIPRRKEILSALNSVLDEGTGGKPVCIHAIVASMAMNIVTGMLMSRGSAGALSEKENLEFQELIKESFSLAAAFNVEDYVPWLARLDLQGYKRRLRSAAQRNDVFFQKILDDHRRRHEMEAAAAAAADHGQSVDRVQDIVDVLLTRPRDIDGENLSDSEIKAILLDVLFAAVETTSTTVEWGLSELIRNPQVLKKAQAEMDSVVGTGRIVDESDLPNLPYLQAIVKETLRLHPPGAILIRQLASTAETCHVEGYDINPGTWLLINTYALHRDPELWDGATEFYPERFLDGERSRDLNGKDYEFLPFGSGRRMCAGKNMALLVDQHALAVLVQACDWTLPGGQVLDMSEVAGMSTGKLHSLSAIVSQRLPKPAYGEATNVLSML